MGVSKEVQLGQGESAQVGPYTLTFLEIEQLSQPPDLQTPNPIHRSGMFDSRENGGLV